MKYISLFSGIGGLEHAIARPASLCEKDPAARKVLSLRFPGVPILDDVIAHPSEKVDAVVGGWPCQDLTVAGKMRGIAAPRSGLFFEMVRLATECRAETVVGENVPNLLRLRQGEDFRLVLRTLHDAGFSWISWRTLDAREFGLPQARKRVFIVASKSEEVANSLHRRIGARHRWRRWAKEPGTTNGDAWESFGFYWTGGLGRSLCLTKDAIPPLKVGSSTSKGTSPVAVFSEGEPRRLSGPECIRLQGFDDTSPFEGHIEGDVFRMAGNAVPKSMGEFAMGSLTETNGEIVGIPTPSIARSGRSSESGLLEVRHSPFHAYAPLALFLSDDYRTLSPQASAGLLTRVIRAERKIPLRLFDALYELSRTRTRLIGTKINSFEVLDEELDAHHYRRWLVQQAAYPPGALGE